MVNSIVLQNASIIDGSGSMPYSGHLVIKENRIDSILKEEAFSHDKEARVIDLKGKMPHILCFLPFASFIESPKIIIPPHSAYINPFLRNFLKEFKLFIELLI